MKPKLHCRPGATSAITGNLFSGKTPALPGAIYRCGSEFYEARFQVPRVGNADTFAYYIEAKYKFTPQLFGAIRWNQQLFGDVSDPSSGSIRWSQDLARIDLARRLPLYITYSIEVSI